ncbi:MAG: hypothetical protein ACFN4M_02405 [Segatella salivae]|uniref:hypothetical protein n=1 Tax=Segatella salivae TaxID=228604 RepID=UPI001CB0933F|nr:hypothetical protein [Segatella salivae]MBF1543943.1 hypothetical protein [Segatella salivae]
MKHYFFLFLMICFCPFYAMGQDDSSVKMTELTDESQLVDGGIYIMTGYADNQYFGSQYKLFNASYYFSSGIEEENKHSTKLSDLLPYCDLLCFERHEDGWYVRNLTSERIGVNRRYLCADKDYNGFLKLNYLPTTHNVLLFKKENSKLEALIGGEEIRYDKKTGRYLLGKEKATTSPVSFFQLENASLLLCDILDIYSIHTTAHVRLKRHFKSDCFNTLILPFKVENYKKVFGEGALAYLPMGISDGKLHFKSVNGPLEANTPYLLCGKLDVVEDDVHDFGLVKLSYDQGVSLVNPRRGITCHGVYKADEYKPKKGTYFFGDSKLYKQETDEKINMKAFRWSFTSSETFNAKAFSMEEILSIIKIPSTFKTEPAKIYTLGGLFVGTSLRTLPKGIYIFQGRKIVIK